MSRLDIFPSPIVPVLPAWTCADGTVLPRDHVVTTEVQTRVFRWTDTKDRPTVVFEWSYRYRRFVSKPVEIPEALT